MRRLSSNRAHFGKTFPRTYPGLRLRDKGRSFQEAIIQNPYWWELSLKVSSGFMDTCNSCPTVTITKVTYAFRRFF